MKDSLERLKDILYNISDYLIMGAIVIVIGLIIGWRLDILFPDTTRAMVDTGNKIVSEKENPEISQDSKVEDLETEDKEVVVEEVSEEVPETIRVSIPKGSPSTSIANILVEKKLVETTKEFEDMVQKLDLEKSLRSGHYDIEENSSLESIVKIIANQK